MFNERWLIINGILLLTFFSYGCGRIWGGVIWDSSVIKSVTYSCNYAGFLIGTPVSSFSPLSPGNGFTFSVTPSLPGGLSLNSTTGVISGTPTGATAITTYTVSAHRTSDGASASATINIQTDSGYVVNDLVHDSDWASGGCVSGVGTCTLRAAIDSPAPPNLIVLPAGSTTLTLATVLTVAHSTSIYGDCAQGTVVDGNNAQEIFSVTAGPSSFYNLTLQHGLVSGGSYGGALYINASIQVNIYDSSFISNSATGAGAVGGGIVAWEPTNLTIVGSTFFNNAATSGGAALSAAGAGPVGPIVLTNDTFDANTSPLAAAIYGDANYSITNSTFSNNSTTGCCTAAITTGALALTAQFTNNLFYKNSGGASENCHNWGSATFLTLGNNLTDNNGADCNLGGSDFLNTSANLGPLQNNGGLTLTQSLMSGSPGIDQGNTTACSTIDSGLDQRGYPRLVDGKCDIGASESLP